MDLKKFDVVGGSNAGFDLQLVHPGSAESLPLFVRVLGSDSAEYKKVDAELNRKRIDKLWTGGKFRASAQTTEEADAANIERLAAVTKDWWEVLEDKSKKHTLEVSGEMYTCSKDYVVKLFQDYPWIKEQVWTAVHDRGNFIKG